LEEENESEEKENESEENLLYDPFKE